MKLPTLELTPGANLSGVKNDDAEKQDVNHFVELGC